MADEVKQEQEIPKQETDIPVVPAQTVPEQEEIEQVKLDEGVVEEPVLASSEAKTGSALEDSTAQPALDEPLKPEPAQNTNEARVLVPSEPPRSLIREIIASAQLATQARKRKKLDKIMGLFPTRTSVTNDEVEKLLHVSDATATRYLTQLEKEGKIRQNGKVGRHVSYSKI